MYKIDKQSEAERRKWRAEERKRTRGGRASDRVTATGTGEETPAGGPSEANETKQKQRRRN